MAKDQLCRVAGVRELDASLSILLLGSRANTGRLISPLTAAGHRFVVVTDLAGAVEALMSQRFDAVLLTPGLPDSEIAEFTAAVRELDSRDETPRRTPILSTIPEGARTSSDDGQSRSGIDIVVPDSIDPDALTLAIARLASAVTPEKETPKARELAPELCILDIEELKEQVAHDSELLIELIDLYLSERTRQSQEMAAALEAGDCKLLSRIAHTIKGSLGSLHADAARSTAQALEVAARDLDGAKCRDLLPYFEQQLDQLEEQLRAVKQSLSPE